MEEFSRNIPKPCLYGAVIVLLVLCACVVVLVLSVPRPGDLNYGQTVHGDIKQRGSQTWYFEGKRGDSIDIRVVSDFDSLLELTDPNDNLLKRNDDSVSFGGDARIFVTLPLSGQYKLIIRGYDGDGGSYQLSLQKSPLPAGGGQIRYGETISSLFNGGYIGDEWRFQAQPGDTVTIILEGDFNNFLELLNPDGARVAYNAAYTSRRDSIIQGTLPRAGTYTIVVSAFGFGGGNYTLSLTKDE